MAEVHDEVAGAETAQVLDSLDPRFGLSIGFREISAHGDAAFDVVRVTASSGLRPESLADV